MPHHIIHLLQACTPPPNAAAERRRRTPPLPMIFRPRRRRCFQTAYRRESAFHAECAVSCFQQNNFWANSNIWHFRKQYFLIIYTRVADIVYVDIFPLIYSFAIGNYKLSHVMITPCVIQISIMRKLFNCFCYSIFSKVSCLKFNFACWQNKAILTREVSNEV